MKRLITVLCCCSAIIQAMAQESSDGRYALPETLAPLPKGELKSYPKANLSQNSLRQEFSTPPKGYGNVPFYWWSGDKLTKEKLRYQLDILKESPLDGFAVSYIHTHPRADKKFNENGHGEFGRTEPGKPGVMTDEWQETWRWFSGECAKENIGVGLDDYTFAWRGNGYYPDEIASLERMKNYQGQLKIKKDTLQEGDTYVPENSAHRLSLVAWELAPKGNPAPIAIQSTWNAPKGVWVVYDITTAPNYMLEPTHGKELVERYFQRIEDRMSPEERKGANYYFQDELSVPLNLSTWSEDFAEIFRSKKGYDIIPYLAALEGNIGKMTEKVRLDYADVLMTLAEERYFKPVFDWHWQRGLIYGSDNFSRGSNPIEYVDYFRATRWFTAPGNDAPARGSSLMSCKVSSSIAHLYERPRTWLEAFHSMGWSSSGEWLTSQLDHHMIAGGNLLCLHGLYYSTRGGWWEWAPPDFHFRMPYWEHMKKWLRYGERMSYLLSQGTHACDIAVLYPTEAMQGVKGKSQEQSFKVGKNLFYSGLDFDFIDYQSVARSNATNGTLDVSKEHYKVLVLADIPAMHHSTLTKALEHFKNGGIVIATGELPYATTLDGRSENVDRIVKTLFGVTAEELKAGKQPQSQTSEAGGKTYYATPETISAVVSKAITPDFIGGGDAKVMHRKAAGSDIYMVMNVKEGAPMFFRTQGKPELWNAESGTFSPLPVLKQDETGTTLRFDNKYDRSYLIVFSEGVPQNGDGLQLAHKTATRSMPIEGEWTVEQLHTMDNSFGDFRMPVREKMIGAEARTFRTFPINKKAPKGWFLPTFDDTKWDTVIYGYGTQALQSFSTEPYDTFKAKVKAGTTTWSPYRFSWQFGVWEQPGNQGYHGLKGKVEDNFFIMGEAGNYAFKTAAYVSQSGNYTIVTEGTLPTELLVDGEAATSVVALKAGWHDLLALYKEIPEGEYAFSFEVFDERARGAVILIPEGTQLPAKHDNYSDLLAMRWEECTARAKYDPAKGTNKAHAFRFNAAPGLEALEISAFGSKPSVWVDGEAVPANNITPTGKETIGATIYKAVLPKRKERTSVVAFSIVPTPGYSDAAILPYPVRMICGKGTMEPCNWGENGELRHYSGGMRYQKEVIATKEMLNENTTIDLGEVTATCEVHVNGINCGILLNSPFKMEIGKFLKEGPNQIEVIVYSTLSNHYQTIPTPRHYRGDAKAGLIGPIKIAY